MDTVYAGVHLPTHQRHPLSLPDVASAARISSHPPFAADSQLGKAHHRERAAEPNRRRVARLTRAGRFSVQPVMHCGFVLQPFAFFDRNPTLDIPPATSSHSCCA
jgi:hypothetical protein